MRLLQRCSYSALQRRWRGQQSGQAAERVGFEPTRAIHPTAFRERHFRPLRHLSAAQYSISPGVRQATPLLYLRLHLVAVGRLQTLVNFLANESFGHFTRNIVMVLDGRRLHQVGAWALQRAADTAIQPQLDQAHRVYDDAGGVWRIPHLELQFHIERYITERAALQANIRPFVVCEPSHVVGWADMDVVLTQIIVQLTRHGVGLTDLLRLQALALEHIIEVSIAANIQLHRAFQLYPALAEEPRQHAMHNCCPDLAFDIVTDHRQIGLFEALLPVLFAGNEHRNAVYETCTCLDNLLDIPLGRRLRADRQVVDHHIGPGVFEYFDDIVGLRR